MAERIRFHLDEHMDPDIAAALRRHGVDVTTTVDVGLRTAGDDAQFAYVQAERRVIITDDPDFISKAAETADHPGIVVCPRRWLSPPTVCLRRDEQCVAFALEHPIF